MKTICKHRCKSCLLWQKQFCGIRTDHQNGAIRPGQHLAGVLRAVEGSLAPITCLQSEINNCERCDQCATLWFWEGMDKAINDYVDQYTLQDFVDHMKL